MKDTTNQTTNESREVAALRRALEEAALVVNRTETKLAAALVELEAEKRRSTQHHAAFLQTQEVQRELEVKLRTQHRDVVQTSSQGLTVAMKLERLETEQKRLKQVVVGLTVERDQLRTKLEGRGASAESNGSRDFLAAPDAETRAMALSLQCEPTERIAPRLRSN